jgi:hypothetical protein
MTTVLDISLINARSLKSVSSGVNKMRMYKSILEVEKPDILCVVETWLNSNINDHELTVGGYHNFRKDRKSRGGGILLSVKNTLTCSRRMDLEVNNECYNEIMVIEFKPSSNFHAFIVVIYRPPSADKTFNDNLKGVLTKIHSTGCRNILMLGDLNLPDINWESLTADQPISADMCETLDLYSLYQINLNPSRRTNNNVLDIVLSNDPDSIVNIHTCESLLKSDHLQLNFKWSLPIYKPDLNAPKKTVYMFKDINLEELKYYIDNANLLDLVNMYSYDVDIAWQHWKQKLVGILNVLIPKKIVKSKNCHPWVDGEVVHLSNKKMAARKKAIRSGSANDWTKFKQLNNKIKNLVRSKYNKYVNNAFSNIDKEPKKFWSIVSNKNKHNKGSIPNEIFSGNIKSTDPFQKAQLFNRQFYSNFNSDQSLAEPNITEFVNLNLNNVQIQEFEVYEVLENLDTAKAHGPDGLPIHVYKLCAFELTPSITKMYNLSLLQGKVPSSWKIAHVVPIFKKGDTHDVQNYRPISLLPTIGKIMERCLHNYIWDITKLELHNNQHGFFKHRSTNTQLTEFYHKVSVNMDNKIQTDVIYLDLSKAFDCIPHHLLVHKLKSYGFNGGLLTWIKDYLSNRQQKVLLEGYQSDALPVISGVPQGSILGPLFFLFYINDLFTYLPNDSDFLYLYADDSKLGKSVYTINDCLNLQHSLANMCKWSQDWGMTFNPSKCCIMSFVSNRQAPIIYDYKISNTSLSRVNSFCDLGLIVANDLSWDLQVQSCLSKANKRLGLIKRTLGCTVDTEVKLMCFKSLIRPILEYCTLLWSGTTKKNIKKIESLQRRASIYVLNNSELSYKDRLLSCDVLPLTLRRDYLDLVYFYNLNNGIHDTNLLNSFTFCTRVGRNTDNLNLVPKRVSTEQCKYWYVNRIVHMWNKLPLELRELELTDMGRNTVFKKDLKAWLYKHFIDTFDPNCLCTWSLLCFCTRCKLI